MRIAWASAAALLFVVAASCTAVEAGYVGMLKCDSQTMVSSDYAALKRAATRAAAPHLLNWKDVTPCLNPGRGRVWIAGIAEPQSDGTRIDVAMLCLREARPWKCELQNQRRYEFSMRVHGRDQAFRLDIPPGLDAGEARAFAVQAFERGATLSARDACESTPREPRTARDDERDEYMDSTFTARERPVDASIEVTERGMTFTLGGFALDFSRPSPSVPWKFECWSIVVIVT